MSATCPNGHESNWPDWCSTCGERIGGDPGGSAAAASGDSGKTPAVAAPAAKPTGKKCDNCGVPRHEHDVFCESCGYDFASGSLPDTGDDPAVAQAASHPPMHAKVSVDPEFFAASVGDVDLTLPDPAPDTEIVPLSGTRVLIGRQSTSRGIFPEIDVRELTDDPAVSSRHAMLERATDGAWTLTDLGSTNGTFLTTEADNAVEVGTTLPIAAGDSFFIGAWTRIELAETA